MAEYNNGNNSTTSNPSVGPNWEEPGCFEGGGVYNPESAACQPQNNYAGKGGRFSVEDTPGGSAPAVPSAPSSRSSFPQNAAATNPSLSSNEQVYHVGEDAYIVVEPAETAQPASEENNYPQAYNAPWRGEQPESETALWESYRENGYTSEAEVPPPATPSAQFHPVDDGIPSPSVL